MDSRIITIQGNCTPEEYGLLLAWFLKNRVTTLSTTHEPGRLSAGSTAATSWIELITLRHTTMEGYEVRLTINPRKAMFFPEANTQILLELMALMGLRTLEPEEVETKWVCTGCGHSHDIRPAQCDVCLGTSFNASARPKRARLV